MLDISLSLSTVVIEENNTGLSTCVSDSTLDFSSQSRCLGQFSVALASSRRVVHATHHVHQQPPMRRMPPLRGRRRRPTFFAPASGVIPIITCVLVCPAETPSSGVGCVRVGTGVQVVVLKVWLALVVMIGCRRWYGSDEHRRFWSFGKTTWCNL